MPFVGVVTNKPTLPIVMIYQIKFIISCMIKLSAFVGVVTNKPTLTVIMI